MSNVNIHKTSDNLDVATPQPPHILSAATRQHAPRRWDAILAHYAGGLAAAGLAWWLAPEWAHNYVVAASLGLGTLAAAKRVFTDTVAGLPVRTWYNHVSADRVVDYLGTSAVEDARRALPSVSSYSPSYNHSAHTVDGQVVEDSAALPAPVNVGPLPADQWLAWLDKQPHAIFAAKTGGGKSTIAKYGLLPRINGGEWVFIIDPHSNGWFDLPGVGGGEHWARVEAAMMAVYAEYKRRLEYRDEYKRSTGEELAHDYFPRLTVVFDEANNAKEAFSRIYSGQRRRLDPWPLFAQCLGSGARKVGISVWLLVQSALVEDLGLSGAMRQNFTRIAMDLETIRQMTREETNKERREAIAAALVGASYPATAMMDSEVYLLDRAGLDRPPTPRNSRAAAWDGWDYANNVALVEDADTMPALPKETQRHVSATAEPLLSELLSTPAMRSAMDSTPAKAQKAPENAAPRPVMQSITHNKLDEWQRDELVRILFRKGWTYRQVREGIAKAGLTVDQNRLTMLRNEAMK